jgi:hypothetical protein
MSKLDFQTLSSLSEKGVDFFIAVPNECGQMTFRATPEDLVIFADDPAAIYAKAHEVTKSEYRDWIDDECMAHCAAKTRAGRRCRNMVLGGYQVSAKRWVELQGGYCGVHGE